MMRPKIFSKDLHFYKLEVGTRRPVKDRICPPKQKAKFEILFSRPGSTITRKRGWILFFQEETLLWQAERSQGPLRIPRALFQQLFPARKGALGRQTRAGPFYLLSLS